MVIKVQWRTVGRLAAMVMVAGLGLAACGSDGTTASGSGETSAAAATTAPAETTTTEAVTSTAATTTAYVDPTLAVIAKMDNCNTLNSLVTISTGERDGAKDAGKKLYQDRVDAAQKRIAELTCEPAPPTTAAAVTTTSAG